MVVEISQASNDALTKPGSPLSSFTYISFATPPPTPVTLHATTRPPIGQTTTNAIIAPINLHQPAMIPTDATPVDDSGSEETTSVSVGEDPAVVVAVLLLPPQSNGKTVVFDQQPVIHTDAVEVGFSPHTRGNTVVFVQQLSLHTPIQ